MTTGCFETSLLLFVNARGQGHYQLSNARSPVLIVKQMLGVCPGGGKCTRLELTRTLLACTNLVTLIFQAISAANGQWKLPWRRAVALFNVSELWFLEYSPSSSYVGEYSPTIHLHFREQLIIVIIIIVFITVLFLLIINVLLIAIIIHFNI